MNKIKIILVIVFLLIGFGSLHAQNFTHKVPSPSVKAHRDIQNYSSFTEWERRQPKVRKKAAKASKKQKKAVATKRRKLERLKKFENKSRSV